MNELILHLGHKFYKYAILTGVLCLGLLVSPSKAAAYNFSATLTGPSTVEAGDTITYTVKVKNNDNFAVSNIRVAANMNSLPDLTFVSSNDGCNLATNKILYCTYHNYAAGQTREFTLTVRVSSTLTCNTEFHFSIDLQDTKDSFAWSNPVHTRINCETDVSLVKEKMSPTTVEKGGYVQFKVMAKNESNVEADNVVIRDAIPSGLQFDPSHSDNDCFQQGNDVVCHRNTSLAPNEFWRVFIAFTIPYNYQQNTCPATIRNTAEVETSTPESNTSNNRSNTVNVQVECPNITVTKSGPAEAEIGTTYTYNFTVRNNGTVTQNSITLVDVIPNHLTFEPAGSTPGCIQQNNKVICQQETYQSGQTRNFSLNFSVKNTAPCNGTIYNIAEVQQSNQKVSSSNQVSTKILCPPPSFTITKTAQSSTVDRDGFAMYTIHVKNTGTQTVSGIRVADNEPPGFDFEPAGSTSGCASNGTTVFCPEEIYAPGQSRDYVLKFRVTDAVSCNAHVENVADVQKDKTSFAWSNHEKVKIECPQANLEISKTDNRTTVQPGETLTYVIDIKNTSAVDATNIVVADQLPADVTFVSSSNGGIYNNGAITWTNVNVNAGSTVTFTVVATVKTTAANGTVLKNSVGIAGGPTAVDYTTVQIAQTPTFSITKTDGRTTVQPGENLTYTIDVTNTSTVNATNVDVTDTLPSQVTFVSASNGGSHNNGTVTWDNVNINAGSTISRTVTVTVKTSTTNGTVLTNKATVVGGPSATDETTVIVSTNVGCIDIVKETFDTNGNKITPVAQFTFTLDGGQKTTQNDSNGNASFTNVSVGTHSVSEIIPATWKQLSVTPTNGQVNVSAGNTCSTVLFKNQQVVTQNPTFSITKTDGHTTVQPGETLTYTIDVKNISTTDATDIDVMDTLPAEVTFVSASNGGSHSNRTVTWDNVDITAGATITRTVTVTVKTSATNGTVLTNQAIVVGGPTAIDTTTVSVAPPPVLTITKTDGRTTAKVGDTLTYTITIHNSSTTAATNVTIEDTLPSELTFISASNGGTRSGQKVTWSNITIPSGSTTLIVNAKVQSGTPNNTTIFNTVQILGGNSATDTTLIQGDTSDPNNVTIDLTDLRDPVEPDDTFCYNIRLTNLNSTELRDLTVTQTLDSQTDFSSASDSGSHSSRTITWRNVNISANGTKSLGSCVRVDEDAEDNDLLQSTAFVSNKSDNETTRVEDDDDNGDDECRIQSISDNPDPVRPGETLTYNIRIENESNRDREYDIRVFLDSRVSFLSASHGGDDIGSREVEWENYDIDENEVETLRLTVRVLNNVADGETIRIQVHCEDDSDTESTRVEGGTTTIGEATLSVDKSANRHEAKPGDTIIYSVTVRNLSNKSATNVLVADRFTSGSISIEDAGGGVVAGNGINWTIPVLSANQSRTYSYRVRVGTDMRHGQIIANTVRASSPSVDRDATDLEEVHIITDLPQTGLGSFFRAWQENKGYLKPSKRTPISQSSGSQSGAGAWATIASFGVMMGGVVGRKLWL